MIRLLTIIGARPQFIKASAVNRHILSNEAGKMEETILHTGQHYDITLNEVFFRELNLPEPAVNLETGSGPPGWQVGEMTKGIGKYLSAHHYDCVLVYGDTNSTLAGALAASRNNIPVAHVEAGLRSGNKRMQEEVNRILTDHMSTLLFAPTPVAVSNLGNEGFDQNSAAPFHINNPGLFFSGDIMLENLMHYKSAAFPPDALQNTDSIPYALVTVHRAETLRSNDIIENLAEGLLWIQNKTGFRLVCPFHPAAVKAFNNAGPQARKLLRDGEVLIINPVSYLNSIWLMQNAEMVLTDSGGLQKEACFLEKKCLILRDETEWKELAENGLCTTAGTTKSSLEKALAENIKPSADAIRNIFGASEVSAFICDKISDMVASN